MQVIKCPLAEARPADSVFLPGTHGAVVVHQFDMPGIAIVQELAVAAAEAVEATLVWALVAGVLGLVLGIADLAETGFAAGSLNQEGLAQIAA